MDSFVAIDFETATSGVSCALGLAHFENGVKIEERYTLINPRIRARDWDRRAIGIHGIRPEDVEHSPCFGEIWPELVHYAACYPLVAHNAAFDLGVLRNEMARAGLAAPLIRYGCSMQLARTAWPRRLRANSDDLPENHKLSTLSEFLGVELNHHNALSDAIACGEVTLSALDVLGRATLASAYDGSPLRWGLLEVGAAA